MSIHKKMTSIKILPRQKGGMSEELTFKTIADLLPYKKDYSKLKSLSIKDKKNVDEINALAIEVSSMTALTSLDMSGCYISSDFIKALQKTTALTSLTINFSDFDKNDSIAFVKSLVLVLPKMKDLTTLSLVLNDICKKGATLLASVLPSMKKLEGIDLSKNELGDIGACEIAKAIEIFQETVLTPNNKNINNIIESALVNANFRKADPTIPFDERIRKTVLRIERYMGKSNKLIKLNLDENNIGNKGAVAIANALNSSKRLTTLSIAENKIGNKGAIAIAEGLSKTPNLTHLDLSVNEIGDAGGKAIVKAIKSIEGLTIDVSENKISDKYLP